MLGLPPDTVSILLLLLGVFGAPPLVMAHPSIVSARDVQRLRSAYGAAARTFCMPWQLRVLVATTRVDSCGRLRLTVAYLRLSRVLAKVVRLALAVRTSSLAPSLSRLLRAGACLRSALPIASYADFRGAGVRCFGLRPASRRSAQ